MIKLSYVYPFAGRQLSRLLSLVLLPGVITILCHALAVHAASGSPRDFVVPGLARGPSDVVPVVGAFALHRGGRGDVECDAASADPGPGRDGRQSRANIPATVTDVGDVPVITGQKELTTQEDVSVTIGFGDLVVEDADSTYPAGFTLQVLAGEYYTVSAGQTIVPARNYNGQLTVPVTVYDGTNYSNEYPLVITVTPVNDPPRITGQVPLQTAENQTIALDVSQLVIEDPDNEDADPKVDAFTLGIMSGDHYSAAGNQITPAAGFNGTLEVGVFVNDGTVNSDRFPLQITVTAVNDPPVITGQREGVTTLEDTPITLTLQDLIVTDSDPDDVYPNGYTLIVQAGDFYTVSGTTVTPAADFTGSLHVNVVVYDGVDNSDAFPFAIAVSPVNDRPVITGPATMAASEDVPFAIALTDLQVTDPDNSYPSGFSLLVSPGAHYTVAGNAITPEHDYAGMLAVPVQVSDGALTSDAFTIAVNVAAVNDPPVITAQVPVQTGEDEPVTLQLSDLSVLDVDNAYPAGFSLVVSPGVNYTVSGATITPATDFNGTLNVGVAVNDGIAPSAPFNFQIQVGNTNDAPTIISQLPLSTNEEQPVTITLAHLVVVDPDNAYPTGFSLLVSEGADFTVSGNTVTPDVNFAGTLDIPVRVNDGINNSATFTFKLQVIQINDPPTFAAIPNQQVAENAPPQAVTITGVSKGPREDDQQLTFVATSGNTTVIADPVVQYNGGSTATLSWSVVPNASGIVTITVIAIDNGSAVAPNRNSYSASFQIEVLAINSAPTLDPIRDLTILEDAEQQQVTLTGISAGPGENQVLAVSVNTERADLFELLEVVYTSPQPSALLRFKTAADSYGTARVTVTVTDNGPGTSPHANKISRTFSIVIQPVNDPPVFVSTPVTLAVAGEPYAYEIRATDVDGENVSIKATAKPSWGSLSGGRNGQAALKGKPGPNTGGNVEVVLTASDAATSVEQRFSIYVNERPVVRPLALATAEDTQVSFPAGFFDGGYADANGNALVAMRVVTTPGSGTLTLGDVAVAAGDTIAATSLAQLVYTPAPDYFGMDAFLWKAFDGYHASASAAPVDIKIVSVNDPPHVVLESDTLKYEVNGEPALLVPLIDIVDVDDDTLTGATVSFHTQTYRPQTDLLSFENSSGIRGNFDFQSGLLEFTGTAPIEAYRAVLRSILYVYQNTTDPLLEPKQVTFTLNDGEAESEATDKVIMLQYTFVEFEIPSGFTPNGDSANDTWIIDRPGGGLEEMDDAVISVYNKRGELVYRTRGFSRPWDGRRNGELLPADTYFYTIDLQLRSKKTYKGIVTILR